MKIKQIKLLGLIPFSLLLLITVVSWILFAFQFYVQPVQLELCTLAVIINLFIYYFKYTIGFWVTGIILIVSLFNIITPFPYIDWISFSPTFKGDDLVPQIPVSWQTIPLLLIYFIVGWRLNKNGIKVYG